METAGSGGGYRRALVVVADPQRGGLLAKALRRLGVAPVLAFGVDDALASLAADSYCLVVAYADAVGPDAGDFTAAIRARHPAVFVAVTARSARPEWRDQPDIVVADTLGEEPLAALAVASIRATVPPSHPVLRWGPLRVDTARREAWCDDVPIALTPIQFRLLVALVEAGGALITPVELSRRVWGFGLVGDSERVSVQVRRVRKKLEVSPARAGLVVTVRGEGFRLGAT